METWERFSNRVDDYIKFRPTYAGAAIHYLFKKIGFGDGSVIADIGSGTGIFTRQIIDRVGGVYAVEPNESMREAAKSLLSLKSNYMPVDASAEHTGLPSECVDFITVAQAFHWLDRERCKTEFRRILRPGGQVVIIYNNRLPNTDYFAEFESALDRFAPTHRQVSQLKLSETDFEAFFGGKLEKADFSNDQRVDFETFKGRIFSSSYAPLEGESYEGLVSALEKIFIKNAFGGKIKISYRTVIYHGEI